MTARLNEHKAQLDEKVTTIAIFNSQKADANEEITGLYEIFLFLSQIRKLIN